MAIKNIGNFVADTITLPSAPGAQPMLTMDAAGIASGGAFLISELEKRDTLIREPLTSMTYPRDIPIEVGGGWVDYVSAMGVAYGITGGSGASPAELTAFPSFRLRSIRAYSRLTPSP